MLRDPLAVCQMRREEGGGGINYYCSGKSGQSHGRTPMRSDDDQSRQAAQ